MQLSSTSPSPPLTSFISITHSQTNLSLPPQNYPFTSLSNYQSCNLTLITFHLSPLKEIITMINVIPFHGVDCVLQVYDMFDILKFNDYQKVMGCQTSSSLSLREPQKMQSVHESVNGLDMDGCIQALKKAVVTLQLTNEISKSSITYIQGMQFWIDNDDDVWF